jgi:intracellular septation protein
MNPIVKFFVEVGPLAAFFIAYSTWGGSGDKANLIAATAIFMVAIAASLAVSVWLERRVPLMPLVSAAVVFVFGGLTLALDSEIFIKMKPTIINALFAAILFVGLATRRAFLKHMFGAVMNLDEEGWRKLSVRWALFFCAVAVLNEIVWRSFSTDLWVNFKVFGILPLTLVFALSQTPLIHRHTVAEESPTGKS